MLAGHGFGEQVRHATRRSPGKGRSGLKKYLSHTPEGRVTERLTCITCDNAQEHIPS